MSIDPIDLRVTSYLHQLGCGAGGMTVGMTTSGIIVHHVPTGLGVSCDSERSQYANKEKAIELLESLIYPERFQPGYGDCGDFSAQWVEPVPYPHAAYFPGKIQMIKDYRDTVGCGLKEAKEAIDKYGNLEDALATVSLRTVESPSCVSCGRHLRIFERTQWDECSCGYIPAMKGGF